MPSDNSEDERSQIRPGLGSDGRFLPGNRWGEKGGKARAGISRLANRMGLRELPTNAAFHRYKASAVCFRRAQCGVLAKTVGAGVCGPGPSSIVATAAWQLAFSRYLADVAAENGDTDLMILASKLGSESRASLVAAHDLCAREAEARAKNSSGGGPDIAALFGSRS